MTSNLNRFKERKVEFIKATEKLEEALKEEESEIVIDGILHRFEFTFELAWKTMKDYLEYEGIIEKTGSPREVIKEAFSSGLIENGDIWINMMLARNALSHLYDEETSREVYDDIKNVYIYEIEKLLKKLNEVE